MSAGRLRFEPSSPSWIKQITSSGRVDSHRAASSISIQITVFMVANLIRWMDQRRTWRFRALRLPLADDF
jgi:hypothetical protein